jgi:hypothetical protein
VRVCFVSVPVSEKEGRRVRDIGNSSEDYENFRDSLVRGPSSPLDTPLATSS